MRIRSSCSQVFYRKAVLWNLAKFTGKHLCKNLFFNKVAALMPSTVLEKRLWHRCFPVNFAQFFKNIFYYTTPLVAAFEEYIIKSRVALVLTKSILVLISLEIFHQKKIKKRRARYPFKHLRWSIFWICFVTFNRQLFLLKSSIIDI